MSKAKLDATSQRWVAALANYNFHISYRSGHLNGDADGLSRKPITPDVVKAISGTSTAPYYLSMSVDFSSPVRPVEMGESTDSLTETDWIQEQAKD